MERKEEEPKKHVTKLLTLLPEAIKVASEITPTRLANLLIRKGPLPIRLITGQLAVEVPGFEMLSLLKQRRLIMAAMEQADAENNVVFEKIGWGQWAVRKAGLDYIVVDGSSGEGRMLVAELKEKAKLGWLKKEKRRELILGRNLHDTEVPGEMELDDEELPEISGGSSEISEEDDDDGPEDVHEDVAIEDSDTDEPVFAFDHELPRRRLKFANRVPIKVLPPPGPGRRKLSSGGNLVSKNTNYPRHYLRLRLNSEADESLRHSSVLLPPMGSVSPATSWNQPFLTPSLNVSHEHLAALSGRRKLSFNELSIRLTLLLLLPKGRFSSNEPLKLRADAALDTDEEDWAAIGAERLRKGEDERQAAKALVDMSI